MIIKKIGDSISILHIFNITVGRSICIQQTGDRNQDRSEENKMGTKRQEKQDKLVTLMKRMDTGSNFTRRKLLRITTTDNIL